jgi:two-component system copper resistance phosphate regulon response regulator CusR
MLQHEYRHRRPRGGDYPAAVQRRGQHDTAAGFEGGADDYITKPFASRSSSPSTCPSAHAALRQDMLLTRRRCGPARSTPAGNTIDLSAREFALAETFFRHPGQILTREQLLSR